jgi:hypothetical protein
MEDIPMPAIQLKRAERAIERIREQAELPPETAIALQELVDVVRNVEGPIIGAGKQGAHPSNGRDGPAQSPVIPAYGLGEGHFRRAIRSGKADGIADLFCKKNPYRHIRVPPTPCKDPLAANVS